MPKQKRKINSKAVFRVFWQQTKEHPWLFGLAIAGSIISQIGEVTSPLFIKQLFNLLTTPSQTTFAVLSVPIVLYAAVRITAWFGTRVEMWFGYALISKVTAQLTKEAFSNLIRHSYHFFTSSFAGALTRRVSRFSGAYESLFYSIETVLFQAVLYVIGIVAVLMYHSWIIGTIVLGWVLLFVMLQWWLSRIQQPLRLKRAEEDSNVVAALADTISNQNTVTLFSGYFQEKQILGDAADRFQKAQLKSWNTNTIIYGLQGLLTILLNVGALWVGVYYWQAGVLTLGDLVLIQAYVFGLFEYVWNIGRQFQNIHNALADASEMIDIMESPFGVADKKGAKKIKVTDGEVWFDDVNFTFAGGRDVLKQFNLKIAGGEKVALVGPSGAGKSTVTKLLLRLYDVDKGGVLIDNQNVSAVTQESLRDSIAFVPQEPILFHRTLMENIRYGRRDATDEEVVKAAKLAHCHEFIDSLPLKYETYVGERGIKLSGGERQRVAIARAILKNAPILILDEATSSLDSESEGYIQDALETLMQGKTVITVAHRLSTIMKMDRIAVMQGGELVAQGTHLELIREKGLYQKLWSIQAGGFLGDGEKSKDNVEEDAVPLADSEEEQ